jgi:hypothetical protein
MKKLLSRGLLGIAALAVPVSAAMALPMSAHAATLSANSTVKAVTFSADRPDTTSVAGAGTKDSPNGPMWASDNLSLQFSAVPQGDNIYSVTITALGTFDAFANPTTGAAYTGHGLVSGWLNYQVSSATAPNAKNVPLVEPGNVGQGAIMNQLFGGNASVIGGGHYNYTYYPIDGHTYSQVG